MEKTTEWMSSRLAIRPSRRGFFGLAGKAALGLALGLSGIKLAAASCSYNSTDCPSQCLDCSQSGYSCLNLGASCPYGCLQYNPGYGCCISCCKYTIHNCLCGGVVCACSYNSGAACVGCGTCASAPRP